MGRVAISWVSAFMNSFENEITDRKHYLASAGPVLAAVGAMGQVLLTTPRDRRRQVQDQLLDSPRPVDWRKGEHWLGIAGNYSAALAMPT